MTTSPNLSPLMLTDTAGDIFELLSVITDESRLYIEITDESVHELSLDIAIARRVSDYLLAFLAKADPHV